MLAWSGKRLTEPTAVESGVWYIGETNWFKARLGQFGASAGFFGKRRNGHSGGWRWPEGQTKNMRIAFFPVPAPREQPHLGVGLRKWLEALAIEDYRRTHGRIPRVNELVRDNRTPE
jgi:hypothetical protein